MAHDRAPNSYPQVRHPVFSKGAFRSRYARVHKTLSDTPRSRLFRDASLFIRPRRICLTIRPPSWWHTYIEPSRSPGSFNAVEAVLRPPPQKKKSRSACPSQPCVARYYQTEKTLVPFAPQRARRQACLRPGRRCVLGMPASHNVRRLWRASHPQAAIESDATLLAPPNVFYARYYN